MADTIAEDVQKEQVEESNNVLNLDDMLADYEKKQGQPSSSSDEVEDDSVEDIKDKDTDDPDDAKKEADSEKEEVEEEEEKEPTAEKEKEKKDPDKEEDKKTKDELDLDEYEVELEDGQKVSVQSLIDNSKEAVSALNKIQEDEWLKNIIEYRLKGGDVREYWDKSTRDYDSVPDIDLLKSDFAQEFPEAKGDQLERLWKRELKNKYGYDISASEDNEDFDEAAQEDALLYIKRDATKRRSALKEEQEKFKFPQEEAETKEAEQPSQEEIEKQKLERVEQWRNMVEADKAIKQFQESKKLSMKLGDEEFNLEVEDPKSTVDMIVNDEAFNELLKRKDGSIDFDKLAKVMEFTKDPDGYNSRVADFAKKLAIEQELKEEKNIDALKGDKGKGRRDANSEEYDSILRSAKKTWLQ